MPYFVTSKFSFICKCDKTDLKDVSSAITDGKAYISLKHKESLISTYIFPSECYKGKLEITQNGLEFFVTADFSAKTKLSPKAFKEISACKEHTWTTDGLSIPGMSVPINGDSDNELEIEVLVHEKK